MLPCAVVLRDPDKTSGVPRKRPFLRCQHRTQTAPLKSFSVRNESTTFSRVPGTNGAAVGIRFSRIVSGSFRPK